MPILNLDMTQVPDKVPVLDPGTYFLNILVCEFQAGTGNKKDAYNLTLEVSDGPNKGKRVFDSYPIEFLARVDSSASVRLKHLIQSAGLPLASSVDMDALKGKQVQGVVTNRTYKDSAGVVQEAANVSNYLHS